MTQGKQDTQETALVDTAVVKLNPHADAAIREFYEKALKLRTFAASLVVDSADSAKLATDTLSTIAQVKKGLKEKREEFVKPLNGHVKAVNDAFKALSEPIEEADRTVREKVAAHLKAEQARREEEQRINRLRQEAAEAEARLTGAPAEPVQLIHSPGPERTVTESGAMGGRKIWKWELEDLSKVPDEYKILNEALIGKVVRAGMRNIPGIRIYQETIVTVETKKAPEEAEPDAPNAPF